MKFWPVKTLTMVADLPTACTHVTPPCSNNDGNDLVINDESVCSASNNVVDLTMGSDVPSVFPSDENDADWCSICLTQQNKYNILRGDKVNDLVINFIQKLLKKQFPFIMGLQSTLLQSKPLKPSDNIFASHLQVIHCHNGHWMVASTMHSGPTAKVQICDRICEKGSSIHIQFCELGRP